MDDEMADWSLPAQDAEIDHGDQDLAQLRGRYEKVRSLLECLYGAPLFDQTDMGRFWKGEIGRALMETAPPAPQPAREATRPVAPERLSDVIKEFTAYEAEDARPKND
jgi:hypothetical protein